MYVCLYVSTFTFIFQELTYFYILGTNFAFVFDLLAAIMNWIIIFLKKNSHINGHIATELYANAIVFFV